MAASLCKCAIDIKEQLKLASFYVNAASPVGRHGMGKNISKFAETNHMRPSCFKGVEGSF